jgi:riboflavin synthase
MFSGIVQCIGRVTTTSETPHGRRLSIATDWPDLALGQSVAINGCCLTIADIKKGEMAFDVIPETLQKTNLDLLKPSDEVNLERSLKIGDRLDGHWVQGHIDGKALLLKNEAAGDEIRLRLQAPPELAKFLIPKGSVALDGVSLTLAAITPPLFEVALIPTTIRLTTLGQKRPGWPFNLEADILSKTVISWLEQNHSVK